ncbi:MAG TPA: hypothetical protein VMT70_24280 [Vicinamibacteria bacterium]|nr:hypothetical protein [Vicinamibacteria bacterium]
MNVDEWTSVEERKRLLGILKEGGPEALMKELKKVRAGYIVPPAGPQRLIGVSQWKK